MDNENKKEKRGINKYVPVAFWFFSALALGSLAMLFVIRNNSDVATALNRTTGRAIRFVLAKIFGIFPFSFVEMLLISLPILVGLIIFAFIRKGRRGLCHVTRLFCGLMCVVFAVFSAFVFGYEMTYYGSTVEEDIGVERRDLSPDELKSAALMLLDGINGVIDEVPYLESGESVMPWTFSEFNEKINEAYEKFNEKYPAYQKMKTRAKPVMLSEPWTYTHTSGLYSFFTGEANINVNYPDFIVVTTVPHEMSHQRGVGKEDECNFIAFLVCIGSDDAYIRYCGYIDLYDQIMGKLYGADKDAYKEVRALEDPRIRKEISAYSAFYDKYKENVAATVSNTVNNSYIKSHNQPAGIKSYGLVIDLAVNYLLYSENNGG